MANEQSDISEFLEGVAAAKKYFIALSQEGVSPLPSTAEGAFEAGWLQARGHRMIKDCPEQLVENSSNDPNDFDSLRYGLAVSVACNEILPESVRYWLIDYLRGCKARPKSYAGRKRNLNMRIFIAHCVWSLVDRGMAATRNDEPAITRNSAAYCCACDAVAVALKELNLKPTSYKRVKTIWQEMKSNVDEDGTVHATY